MYSMILQIDRHRHRWHNILLFIAFYYLFLFACISALLIYFETLGCILNTSFTFLLFFIIWDMYLNYNLWEQFA